MRTKRTILIFLFLVFLGQPQITLSGPIEELKPGEWYEVPNSNLSAVLPDPVPPGYDGPKSIMEAWSGGAYDTKRDRLIVWGGGHEDYGGNEIYVFDINTLKWIRIWGPSPSIPPPGGPCNKTYSDGNPCSRHTYDGLVYLQIQDKFWIYGGSLYCGSGGAGIDTWVFDFITSTWTRKADLNDPLHELEMTSAYDPVTGHVFMAGPDTVLELREYDPVSDRWTTRGDLPIGYNSMTATIDHVRRNYVAIGGGLVYFYSLDTTGTMRRKTLNTTGNKEILNVSYPGVVYDPVSDKIVAWGGGPYVYTLDFDTKVWAKIQPAQTNTVIPTSAPPQGTYGRWQYMPSKNAFVGVNRINENVYIYKLSPGAGSPPLPDNIPPDPPRNLRIIK